MTQEEIDKLSNVLEVNGLPKTSVTMAVSILLYNFAVMMKEESHLDPKEIADELSIALRKYYS